MKHTVNLIYVMLFPWYLERWNCITFFHAIYKTISAQMCVILQSDIICDPDIKKMDTSIVKNKWIIYVQNIHFRVVLINHVPSIYLRERNSRAENLINQSLKITRSPLSIPFPILDGHLMHKIKTIFQIWQNYWGSQMFFFSFQFSFFCSYVSKSETKALCFNIESIFWHWIRL